MTPNDPRARDAKRVLDGLTDLFDSVAPSETAAAEQELRDAGLDPTAVGARFEQLAPQRTRPARERRHGAAAPHATAPSTWRRRALQGSIAALLVGGLAWFLGGDAALRSVRPAPQLPATTTTNDRPFSLPPMRSPARPGAVAQPPANDEAVGSTPAVQPTPAHTPEWSAAVKEWAAPMPPDDEPEDTQRAAGGLADSKSWILDSNNWQQGEGLVPPVVLERIKKGDYWYKVQPVDPEAFKTNYSKKFWAASEANAGKYDVDPETCGLKDVATGKMPEFYFGYPFPKIDPKDPFAACKMAWNFDSANSMGEGQGATFTLNGIDTSGEFKRVKLWLHTQAFLGRHGGPIDNPENLRATSLANVLEPQDIDGVGGLTKRVNDWDSQDKVWFYVPATRRLRRVNAATRSDPVAGLDIFADDLNCYGGKIEYYRWKVIGEQNILAPLLSPKPLLQENTNSPSRFEVNLPYLRAAHEMPGARGIPWLVVDNLVLVPRPVWVLEGESTDPYYNFGKVIMYMDKDMYRIYWKLVHNRAGEYFYNAMCAYHFSKNDSESFSAVTNLLVVGVNDKTNRACLAGRPSSQFIERKYAEDYFSSLEGMVRVPTY